MQSATLSFNLALEKVMASVDPARGSYISALDVKPLTTQYVRITMSANNLPDKPVHLEGDVCVLKTTFTYMFEISWRECKEKVGKAVVVEKFTWDAFPDSPQIWYNVIS